MSMKKQKKGSEKSTFDDRLNSEILSDLKHQYQAEITFHETIIIKNSILQISYYFFHSVVKIQTDTHMRAHTQIPSFARALSLSLSLHLHLCLCLSLFMSVNSSLNNLSLFLHLSLSSFLFFLFFLSFCLSLSFRPFSCFHG